MTVKQKLKSKVRKRKTSLRKQVSNLDERPRKRSGHAEEITRSNPSENASARTAIRPIPLRRRSPALRRSPSPLRRRHTEWKRTPLFLFFCYARVLNHPTKNVRRGLQALPQSIFARMLSYPTEIVRKRVRALSQSTAEGETWTCRGEYERALPEEVLCWCVARKRKVETSEMM